MSTSFTPLKNVWDIYLHYLHDVKKHAQYYLGGYSLTKSILLSFTISSEKNNRILELWSEIEFELFFHLELFNK